MMKTLMTLIAERSNRWQQLREQKRNNKGSSLVLVVSVVAVVGVLLAVLASVSLMNYRMKFVNLQSQNNFYDAEKVLDQIRSGLAEDLSDSVGTAYTAALSQYSAKDENGRKSVYIDTFGATLLGMIEDTTTVYPGFTSTRHYSIPHLEAMIHDDIKGVAKSFTIESADGLCVLNEDTLSGTYTIKNLKIVYVDENDYMTMITTDITLSCPPIDYSQVTETPNLLDYCIVADEQTIASAATVGLNGSAYLGMNGTVFDSVTLGYTPLDTTKDRLVTGGELYVRNGSSLSVADGAELWAHDLRVDASRVEVGTTPGAFNQTNLADDLVLERKSPFNPTVVVNGAVNAFGNTNTAFASEVFVDDAEFAMELNNQPSYFSSAFLINGRNATLNLSGVTELKIAGNAYVGASNVDADNQDVMMGESISLKSDQRAYLVPAKYIAADAAFGGNNPMIASDYTAVCTELADKNPALDSNAIPARYFVTDSSGALPKELTDAGVVDIRREVYTLSIKSGTPTSLVYFFLVFDSAQSAQKYGMEYQNAHQSELNARVDDRHYNTTITYPDAFADTTIDQFRFYYNGNVIVPVTDSTNTTVDTTFLPGKCTILDSRTDLTQELIESQEKFAGLRRKLMDDYGKLTYQEKNRTVFDNLVRPMINSDIHYMIPAGSQKEFVDGTSGALVVNGDYTLSSNTASDGTSKYHIIIATGNITIVPSADFSEFNGLIFAGGNIVINGTMPIQLTADAVASQNALGIKDANGKCAADYLYDSESYCPGAYAGAGEGEPSAGTATDNGMRYDDYITYSNWTKQ